MAHSASIAQCEVFYGVQGQYGILEREDGKAYQMLADGTTCPQCTVTTLVSAQILHARQAPFFYVSILSTQEPMKA